MDAKYWPFLILLLPDLNKIETVQLFLKQQIERSVSSTTQYEYQKVSKVILLQLKCNAQDKKTANWRSNFIHITKIAEYKRTIQIVHGKAKGGLKPLHAYDNVRTNQ
jgi:hypothetical protein